MVKRIFIYVVVFLCLASAGWAADDEKYEVGLGKVLITPRRMSGEGISETEFAGNATVITQGEIEESNAQNIQELLLRKEGLTLIDTAGFGLGSDAGLNLRGIVNTARTGALVLVDGVRQNTITDDAVHWQSMPLDHIKRVEVIRGGSGTLLVREVKPRRKKLRRKDFVPHLPGDLVQMDTVAIFTAGLKRYIFTALDVRTRFAFAYAYTSNSSANSNNFLGKFLSGSLCHQAYSDG